MIRIRILACTFAASICQLPAAPVSVLPGATGLFGWPSRSLPDVNPQSSVMVKLADFTRAGEAVEITASGEVDIYLGNVYPRVRSGPEGINLVRAALQSRDNNRGSVVFTPEEDGILARGGAVPADEMQRLIPRFAGLFGGFANSTSITNPEFSANKLGKVSMGIPAESIFWLGSRKVFIAPGPGSLFVGVNDTDPNNALGKFTVDAVLVKGIRVTLQNFQITEGSSLVGSFTVMDPVQAATEFSISVPGEAGFANAAVVLPPGAAAGSFTLASTDNDLIERHRGLAVQVTAPTFLAAEQEFEYLDNDWRGLDEDGDQMSDIWQRTHQVASWDTDSDPDGDGYSNFEEDKWGTNPRSLSSSPEIRTVLQGGTTCVVVPTQPGYPFRIYGSTDLTNFAPVSGVTDGTGLEIEIEVPTGTATRYFFKRVAVGAKDSDSDGLSDVEERQLGTDPNQTDSDGDGASDEYEVSRFAYFPKVTGVAARSMRVPTGPGNRSGMDKYPKELANPLNPDGDNDGIPDGAELAFFSNQGTATRRKIGFSPYKLPVDANAPIPIYLEEEKSWTGVTSWVGPEGAPCVPDFSNVWGSGFIRRVFSIYGSLRATSNWPVVQDSLDRAIGNPLGFRYSPAAWAYGGVRPGGGAVTELSQSDTAFSGMFHPGRPTTMGCLYSNGQLGYQGAYDIYSDIRSVLSDELTTEENIELAFRAAQPGLLNKFGEPGAYVRVADREREARVGITEYQFSDPEVVCAKVFLPTWGDIEVSPGRSQGVIPESPQIGESGLFAALNPILDTCLPFHPPSKTLFIGARTNFTVRFSAIISPSIAAAVAPHLSGKCSGGTVKIGYTPGLKEVTATVSLTQPLQGGGDLEILVKGELAGKITVSPEIEGISAKFITPPDDPQAPQKGPSLSALGDIIIGQNIVGQNQFVFTKAGDCRIRLEAVLPCLSMLDTNKLIFEVDGVNGSQIAWGAGNQNGTAVIQGNQAVAFVEYVGLPLDNSSFGLKMARLKYDGATIGQTQFKVFFDKRATNHPGIGAGQTPNWFYYWEQGAVPGYDLSSGKYVYGGNKGDYYAETKYIPLGVKEITIYDRAAEDTVYIAGVLNMNKSGVDSFASTLVHEEAHITVEDYWLTGIFKLPDRDNDHIPDDVEDASANLLFDKTKTKSVSNFPFNDDLEMWCEIIAKDALGIHEKDWAYPGKQSMIKK